MSKFASIDTKKVIIGGKPCRKIVKLNNFMTEEEVPDDYKRERPWFVYDPKRVAAVHTVDSKGNADWHSVPGDSLPGLVTRFKKDVVLEGYYLILTEGSVFTEKTFQEIVTNLRECGEHLRAVKLAEWSGIEEVEI